MKNSLVYTLFGKNIHELELGDLRKFFEAEKRETDVLEFKAYADFKDAGTTKNTRDKKKITAIIETICAFLNSDGGVLIWGAPKGTEIEGQKERVFVGELTEVSILLEPDQFINQIAAEISPTPIRILFQAMKAESGSFCYVVEVTRSEFAPHQYKGTYYMRMDGSTRPAPHHFVEALVKRISFPRLAGFLDFGVIKDYPKFAAIPFALTIHNLSKYQNERHPGYRLIVSGADIVKSDSHFLYFVPTNGADIENTPKSVLHFNAPVYEFYFLVTQRRAWQEHPLKITLLLCVYGELSPMLFSDYELQIFPGKINGNTAFDIITKNENVYSFDRPNPMGTEKEATAHSRKMLLESLQKSIPSLPINGTFTFRQ